MMFAWMARVQFYTLTQKGTETTTHFNQDLDLPCKLPNFSKLSCDRNSFTSLRQKCDGVLFNETVEYHFRCNASICSPKIWAKVKVKKLLLTFLAQEIPHEQGVNHAHLGAHCDVEIVSFLAKPVEIVISLCVFGIPRRLLWHRAFLLIILPFFFFNLHRWIILALLRGRIVCFDITWRRIGRQAWLHHQGTASATSQNLGSIPVGISGQWEFLTEHLRGWRQVLGNCWINKVSCSECCGAKCPHSPNSSCAFSKLLCKCEMNSWAFENPYKAPNSRDHWRDIA